MSLLKKLSAIFSSPASASDAYSLYYYVRCRRCREIIKARVDLRNDLSSEYGEGGGGVAYHYRKVLIGRGRCFEPIEVTMTFGSRRNKLSQEVTGGEFVTEEDYNQQAAS